MKQTTFAFIIALGLIAPGLAHAASSADNGNAIYERDLAVWNGAGLDIKTPQQVTQKPRFEYDDIYARDLASPTSEHDNTYKRDLAVWNGAGQGNSALRKGSDQIVASFERDLNRGAVVLTALSEIRIGVDIPDFINTASASAFA